MTDSGIPSKSRSMGLVYLKKISSTQNGLHLPGYLIGHGHYYAESKEHFENIKQFNITKLFSYINWWP